MVVNTSFGIPKTPICTLSLPLDWTPKRSSRTPVNACTYPGSLPSASSRVTTRYSRYPCCSTSPFRLQWGLPFPVTALENR
jgi:hypothetical protein